MTHSKTLELRKDSFLWYLRYSLTAGKSIWLPTAFRADLPFAHVSGELGRCNPGFAVIGYQGAAA